MSSSLCGGYFKVKMIARLFYSIPCILGEGPLWHPQRNSLFWVDIERKSIFELGWTNQVFREWHIAYRVSLILPAERNQLILALQGGLAKFDLVNEELEWFVDIDKGLPGNRCNDGACDANGRLWIGTMDLGFQPGAGSLYCVERGGSIRKELGQVTISNGLVWSKDNKRAYYIDSPTQTVASYLFDRDCGKFSFEKVAIHIPKSMGTPDGMCMDEEGMLWVAHWGGFAVNRWNPANGEHLDQIEVNAPNVSSCAFGGEDLDHLFITTARQDLTAEELNAYPESGSLYFAKLNIKGMRTHACHL
jgi:sugar lactone lactonase YvrE